MPLIIPSNSISAVGYEVDNSLRFDDGSTDYLYRTFTTPTNNKIFTWSGWVKRGSIGTSSSQNFFRTNGATSDGIRFADQSIDGNLDGIRIFFNNSTSGDLNTTQKFRDVSAWYHIVLSVDTTQATASDRVKLYINGEQVTSFNTETYPALNHTPKFNSATQHNIGTHQGNEIFDGYMSEVVFIDGTALDPTSFGEFDADTGIWKPIDVSGLTFGTNGFYLPFENSAALGQDDSGNGNNFTVNNLTSIDQTTDTPTNNFATFNLLARNASNTYSNGNLTYAKSSSYQKSSPATITFSQGKWYAEFRKNAIATHHFGIVGDTYLSDGRTVTDTSANWTYDMKGHTGTICLVSSAGSQDIYADGSDTGTNVDFTSTSGDIIMVAFDADTGKIWFGKNGTWSSSGDPAAGTNDSYTYSGTATSDFTFAAGVEDGNTIDANFGNPPFTISSGNSDANGYGNFEYAVPSGYYALCTKNLAEYG